MKRLSVIFCALVGISSAARADDSATIQALVNNLGATGDVHLACGTYLIGTPISVPSNVPRARIHGDGDCTVLRTTSGNSIFTLPGQGYYGLAIDHMLLDGGSSPGPAIDTSPSSPAYVMAGVHFDHLHLRYWKVGWKLKSAQLNFFEHDHFEGDAVSSVVFQIVPDSGSGQQVDANRVNGMLVTGVNVETVTYSLPTATERATNWKFENCDFQQTGTTVPLTIGDSNWQIENSVFENSSAQNLIVLRPVSSAAVPIAAKLSSLVLTGGTQGKIRLDTAFGQKPVWTTIESSDSSGTTLVDIISATSTVLINNRGKINNPGDPYVVVIGLQL